MKAKEALNIVCIGLGGAGRNVVEHMYKENVVDIKFVIANTDSSSLYNSIIPTKVLLSEKVSHGVGSLINSSIGKHAALESHDKLRTILDGADIVFIAAGLGGGTGTGAAPVVAQIAKEIGALTIAAVTKPFKFEGGKRAKLAEKGLNDLKNECDSVIVIPNDKLLSIIDKHLGMRESFMIVDSVLALAVSGASGVILSHGDNDINLDFADLQTVMCHRGMALIGVGEHQGENAAYEAIKSAIESPLLDNMSINGAMGVLVHFHMHPEFPIMEMTEAMEIVHESANTDADVIFGTTTDDGMPVDAVRIILVATGFEKALAELSSANNIDFVPYL